MKLNGLITVKFELDNYKNDLIAIIALGLLFFGLAGLALGPGLLPDATYAQLASLRGAIEGNHANFGNYVAGMAMAPFLQYQATGNPQANCAASSNCIGAMPTPDSLQEAYKATYIACMMLCAILIYLIARARKLSVQEGFAASAIGLCGGALLLSYAADTGIAPLFALVFTLAGLLVWTLGVQESDGTKKAIFGIAGAIVAGFGFALYTGFYLAGIGLGIAALAQAFFGAKDSKKQMLDFVPGIALIATGAAVGLQMGQGSVLLISNFSAFISASPYQAAAAALCLAAVVRKFSLDGDFQDVVAFAAALVAGSYSIFAGILLLAFAAMGGIRHLNDGRRKEAEVFAAVFAAGFFIALSFGSQVLTTGIVYGLMLGVLVAGATYIYKEHHAKAAKVALLALLLVPITTGALFATNKRSSQSAFAFADFTGPSPDITQAYDYIASANTAHATAATLEHNDYAKYYLGTPVLADTSVLAKYLSSNQSVQGLKAAGVKYIVASADLFTSPQVISGKGGQLLQLRAYGYLGNSTATATSGPQAYFGGSDGSILIRPTDASGRFLVQDSVLLAPDQSTVLAYVPYSELLVLNSDMPYQNSTANLVVWPVSSYSTNLFKMFFGSADGVKQVASFRLARVFEID